MAFILLSGFAAVATVLYLHRIDAGHDVREDLALLLGWISATRRKLSGALRQAWSRWPQARQGITEQLGQLLAAVRAIRFGDGAIPSQAVEKRPPSADIIEGLAAILAEDRAIRGGARVKAGSATLPHRGTPATSFERSQAA